MGKNDGKRQIHFNLDDPLERELLEKIESMGKNFSKTAKYIFFSYFDGQRAAAPQAPAAPEPPKPEPPKANAKGLPFG